MSSFQPHQYQSDAREFLHKQKLALMLLDMGLGKTVLCLDALNRYREMLPALVVAPLQVCKSVWPQEINKFGFDLSYSMIHSKDFLRADYGLPMKGENWQRRLDEKTDIKICNYAGLKRLTEELKRRRRVPFKTVLFDEGSFLRGPKSARTNYAQMIAEHCTWRAILTGTPIPAGYHDLWSQMFVIDRGRTFGSYENFCRRAFDEDYFGRPILKMGADKQIEKAIQRFCFRGDAKELLEMPELVEQTYRVELRPATMERYAEVENGFRNGYDDIRSHTEAAYSPMRCCASGFIYHQPDLNLPRSIEPIHGEKGIAIQRIWDEIGNKNVLVMYNFEGERHHLTAKFGCPFIGRGSPDDPSKLIERWNAGAIPMLACQATSVGFGLNLQAGGHHMIWMSLPDRGDVYDQAVARLYRQGQEGGSVFVYRIVCVDTVEESIERLLVKKLLTQQALLDALRDQFKEVA